MLDDNRLALLRELSSGALPILDGPIWRDRIGSAITAFGSAADAARYHALAQAVPELLAEVERLRSLPGACRRYCQDPGEEAQP